MLSWFLNRCLVVVWHTSVHTCIAQIRSDSICALHGVASSFLLHQGIEIESRSRVFISIFLIEALPEAVAMLEAIIAII